MEGRTAVHLAVAQQNEPAVKALLLNDKCDLSVQDNVKRSSLHWAAVLGLIHFYINPNFDPWWHFSPTKGAKLLQHTLLCILKLVTNITHQLSLKNASLPPGGLLPYMGHIDMCGPKG